MANKGISSFIICCVLQFNLSDHQFVAKAGQYIGWYDEVAGGQGAIGYEDSEEEQACVLTGLHSKIAIGTEVNEVVPSGDRTHLMKNRQYSIEICYGELKQLQMAKVFFAIDL